MRKPVIAGNWKLYKTRGEAIELVTALKTLVTDAHGVEVVVAPVFTVLATVKEALAGSVIHLSGQDCFWEEEGAFTGEVSPKMLLDAGCSHVIIGHSERRQYFGETDETVNMKSRAALASGLTVILCIGETLAEREAGTTLAVLERQLKGGMAGMTASDMQHLIVAYEPVWAIGTGKTATSAQAQEAHAFIRATIGTLQGGTAANAMRILYGGSVKPDNIGELMGQTDVDGALVGGASLKADTFAAIVGYPR
ncbi:MAG TPA: triose-phosphate isomerase [Geobacterales bacterium]|nr:triose-phosphate isomerase [Geobacterales bacterium]